jgi:hypothetical protein
MTHLADIVLAIHFALAGFIALGLLLIPFGAMQSWRWVCWPKLRKTHAGLMIFVAFEALIGMTCPLTSIEAYLRDTQAPESFWAYQLERLLYWDLPPSFFLVLYLLCAAWTIALWIVVPPQSSQKAKPLQT